MMSPVNITWTSVLVNIALTGFKFATGFIGRSQAMVADAIHSLSDLVSDFAVLLGLRMAAKPQDDDHAYGHGKYEAISAAFIGLILLMVGLRIGWEAIASIAGAVQSPGSLPHPTMLAFVAALVSITVKEIMFQATMYTAKRTGHPSLVANAWHHRSDALSSVATAIGIGAAVFGGDRWLILDPLAAILVAALLLHMAWKIVSGQFAVLTDRAMSGEVESEIINMAVSIPHIRSTGHLRTRMVGTLAIINLHIHIDPPDMPVQEAHDVASLLERRLQRRFGKHTISTIHMEPYVQPRLHPTG